jgi:sugar lactone lactonase YvrE
VTEVAQRDHVGGLVPHVDGGLLASGHDLAVLEDDGSVRTVLEPSGGWGFNDLTTDAHGNVYVGMHGERPSAELPAVSASLWIVRPGGRATHCYDGIQMTNGIGLSPDGARLHHVDTLSRTIWVSDVGEDGLPVHRRALYGVPYGTPDGLAIDEAGGIWIAVVGAGRVVRLAPDGVEDLVLEAPSAWVSSLCFGGGDGRDLFITTFGGAPYDPGRSGAVHRTRVATPGAPVHPARV